MSVVVNVIAGRRPLTPNVLDGGRKIEFSSHKIVTKDSSPIIMVSLSFGSNIITNNSIKFGSP